MRTILRITGRYSYCRAYKKRMQVFVPPAAPVMRCCRPSSHPQPGRTRQNVVAARTGAEMPNDRDAQGSRRARPVEGDAYDCSPDEVHIGLSWLTFQ